MKQRQRRGVHPSKDITGSDGNELAGKKIVLCVTGSVAAYRAIDLARLLMRHGADVHAVMSEATASTLLHPEMMKWATGNEVVSKLTGNLEHIALADYGMSDLVIVYPCTANTIGKMVAGIDDTPVTSVLSVALGSKIPIIVAPAMHEAMYENRFIQQNVEKLHEHEGTRFIGPKIEEGKAKAAEPEQVLASAIDALAGNGPLAGRRVLVTAGSTIEYIDPIRVITNTSSGKMGIAIAKEAERMGAEVTLVYGRGTEKEPEGNNHYHVVRVDTSAQMHDAVIGELKKEEKCDIAIMAAAVADYAPASASAKKIDTRNGRLDLSLVATKKIVDDVKKASKGTFLVAFKADYGVSDALLVDKAYKKLQKCGADLVVANDIGRDGSKAGSDRNEVFIVDARKKVVHVPLGGKSEVARKLLELVSESMSKDSKTRK
ncbi:phosphopantothenoylcysteine decarboxylase/phosphopantothenate--cysteine ligase [Candidatus Nitrososphaera evergladensis SR1]|uniref:Coenzyme A biosynthesis bifunctional protein CoaBC n=1 Tax=Candidatus Nitrososphaera evergladensis SR1 TaxID=1459636 RepID=A0A075MTY0_9ARCH|nr:bifunctional phosphopantothenoylcysteine decarboxylase/phosphopantothenate--cysteine ligase CoaBC [Candidatus Nitrososphaera evergladensis]AIF84645.1 phosphopantothenoylcysteine decarboxylase/phosphopantothenate--cysteine ligase [Candidatus Nitrososphaera evergladensis SR1]